VSAALPQSRLEELEAENAELRARLAEAEQTLEAIRGGHVDALVIDTPEGERIFSLAGAERPYRALIEQMQEGAVTLSNDGSIQYCNRAFADLLKRPLETIAGGRMEQYVQTADRPSFAAMSQQARSTSTHGEVGLCAADGTVVPAYVSLTLVEDSGEQSVCIVVTDLTERKQAERIFSSEQFVHGLIERAPIGVAASVAPGAPCADGASGGAAMALPAAIALRRTDRIWPLRWLRDAALLFTLLSALVHFATEGFAALINLSIGLLAMAVLSYQLDRRG